jgi:hypothetical protein
MRLMDRLAVVVTPRRPFYEWVQFVEHDPQLTLEDVREEPSVYLLPEVDGEGDLLQLLELCYGPIFDEQLASWYPDGESWPLDRSFAMFRDWFDVTYHSMVWDLMADPKDAAE